MRLKGKAVPLQVWSGPEGSRNLRFPDFMTTAQDGGKADNKVLIRIKTNIAHKISK
jgi:hypothetical protein